MITSEQVKLKTEERFWSKVKFAEPDECWVRRNIKFNSQRIWRYRWINFYD